MGFKSLGLQMLPWCFQMVQQQQQHGDVDEGGSVSSSSSSSSSSTTTTSTTSTRTVRVVGSDGRVQVYRRPVSASELMREFPRHLVCHSDSFFIGQKVPPLSAEEQLQPGRSYFLLPATFFHSVLTFVNVASSLLLLMKLKPSTGGGGGGGGATRPFDIHKTEKGVLQIRISEEVLVKMSKEEEEAEEVSSSSSSSSSSPSLSRVCSTKELEKEYKQLVVGRKEWRKPRLETIMEHTSSSEEDQIPLAIMKKKKKKKRMRFALIAHLPLLFWTRNKKKERELVLPHTLTLP